MFVKLGNVVKGGGSGRVARPTGAKTRFAAYHHLWEQAAFLYRIPVELIYRWADHESSFRIETDTGDRYPRLDEEGWFQISLSERNRLGITWDLKTSAIGNYRALILLLDDFARRAPWVWGLSPADRGWVFKLAHGYGESVLRSPSFQHLRIWANQNSGNRHIQNALNIAYA